MDLGIKNKKALVTGAGRGIGKSIAINLAKEGAKVVVVSRTESYLKEVLEEMGGEEKGHYMIVCDLTKEGESQRVFEELKEKFWEPDILVNNLGGTLDIKDPFCSIEDWRRVYRINLEVAIELNNLVIPNMKKKAWGRIVNVSSVAAKENQGPVTYCSAKAALNAYTRSMGRLLSPEGIIMVAIMPGAVFTKGGYWDKVSSEYAEQYVEDRMAIKRFGTPDEISKVVTFFCSEQASFCVGSLMMVDGGQGRCF